MNTANVYAPQAAASYTRSSAPSVASSTETSFPGPAAPFSGAVSSPRGGGVALALFLTLLLVVVRHTLFMVVRRRE